MPESASIHLCAAGPRSPIPKRPGRLVGWRRMPDDLVSFTGLILACREQFGQTADGMLPGMPFVRLLIFAVGLWVVLWTLTSAIRTVVLPRGAGSLLARAVFGVSRKVFDLLAHDRREYEDRDRVMAMYAPVSLVLLPAAWLVLVLVGFMAMFWATDGPRIGRRPLICLPRHVSGIPGGSIDDEVKLAVTFPQGVLNCLRGFSLGEQESQIPVALWKLADRLSWMNRDLEIGDSRDGKCCFPTADRSQSPLRGYRQHHHPGGHSLSSQTGDRHSERTAENEVLQRRAE